METMKAAVCTKYGPPEVLELVQRQQPVPKDDEVLIKVRATSVTNSDLFIRSAKVAPALVVPFRLAMGILKPKRDIIGEVLSGVIAGTGAKTTRFKVGDPVYGLTGFSVAAYAEYKCMQETDSTQGCLAIKPDNLSFEEATSAAYGGLLALQFLEPAAIRPGDKVLVYGASSTSGTIAVQYARHLGAEVTAVCSAGNHQFVRELGADKTLDYPDDTQAGRLERYDVVFDCVGKARTSALKKAAQKLLTGKGQNLSIDDSALLLDSGRLDRIRALVESGALRPITDRVYPLEQIVEAPRYVELGHKRGNVAVTVAT